MADNIPEIHIGGLSTKKQTEEAAEERNWQQAGALTVQDAIDAWLPTLRKNTTRRSYRTSMEMLARKGMVNGAMPLQLFTVTVNHNAIVEQIKLLPGWSEATRQARAAAYISFTGFVARRTRLMNKAIPSKEGTARTFQRIRTEIKTAAMDKEQWTRFLKELEKFNPRDALVAKLVLQGGKRINEVLTAQIGAINWEEREITYKLSKATVLDQFSIITYRQEILDDLKKYLNGRENGPIFITKTGKPLHYSQVYRSFGIAGRRAGIPYKITPHVLRASTVTYLKKNGFNDSQIMKITGHTNPEMVGAYDKRERADNISKQIDLV